MAPRKRKALPPEAEPVATPSKRVTRAAAAESIGVTWSSAKRAATSSRPVSESPKPRVPRKKAKKAKGAGKGKQKEQEPEKAEGDSETAGGSSKKTIVIEHCKQCNSFKTRATQVKKGIEEAVSGITVIVNPEKPRRGCFEIREEGGEKFISLLDMKRPFTPMKELDMDKVTSDIVDKIK